MTGVVFILGWTNVGGITASVMCTGKYPGALSLTEGGRWDPMPLVHLTYPREGSGQGKKTPTWISTGGPYNY